MKALGIIAFYLSLLFGAGATILLAFQIGRFGLAPFLSIVRAAPHQEPFGTEDALFLLETQHIPTSAFQLAATLTGFSGIASFLASVKYLWRRQHKLLSFFAYILFGRVALLWAALVLPIFALDIALNHAGYGYWPDWLSRYNINHGNFALNLLLLYISAYLMGRLVGSPQRLFATAARSHDLLANRIGYWFDIVTDGRSYDSSAKRALAIIFSVFDRFCRTLEGKSDHLSMQQLMMSYYQRALINAALERYGDARQDYVFSRKLLDQLSGTDILDQREKSILESQLIFLSAELKYIAGNTIAAQFGFLQSREIDLGLGDVNGIAANDKRLLKIGRPSKEMPNDA